MTLITRVRTLDYVVLGITLKCLLKLINLENDYEKRMGNNRSFYCNKESRS